MKAISRWLDRFCYNHPNFGIPDLMKYIALGNVAVFVIDQLFHYYGTLFLMFNPILIGMAIVVVFILSTGMETAVYSAGTAKLSWLMTPATISLAIPMYEQLQVLKKNGKAIVIGVAAGALTCVIVLVMAINYIQVRSAVNVHQSVIADLEAELTGLKTDNANLQAKVDANTDFEYIYQVATQQLGMVFPNADQLIVYEKTESEYVRQNENIPVE